MELDNRVIQGPGQGGIEWKKEGGGGIAVEVDKVHPVDEGSLPGLIS